MDLELGFPPHLTYLPVDLVFGLGGFLAASTLMCWCLTDLGPFAFYLTSELQPLLALLVLGPFYQRFVWLFAVESRP